MLILLMTIDGYFIGGYWCLLVAIILMVICDYFVNVINNYFIVDYWLLFY